MALWTLLLGVALPVAALVAAAFYVYRRQQRSPRNAPPELPVASGGGHAADPSASPGLAKLNAKYNASSGRVGVRFQQLHHQHHASRHRGRQQQQQQGPFQWGDHPRLVIEAAENGWAQFVFSVSRAKSTSASSSPLWGLCPVCDAGASSDMADQAAWEVPAGSSERLQAVRLNPATASSAAAESGKKWLPGSITSPLRTSDHQDHLTNNSGGGGGSNALCVARMSMPLPGPPMAGAPFPQEAYFEITIIYLNTRRPEWSASSRAGSRRAQQDGSVESDRIKLISFAPDITNTKDTVTESRAATKDDDRRDNKQRHLVMSLGLAAGSPSRPSLAGTYASSIGFHSNGAVYLDGMKLAYESAKSSWAGMDKVVGCGFDPAKRKVFFTVDGQLAHAVSCNADAFSCPLYPAMASSFDVMALVNLGQSKFRYAPANARRTPNPCFVRSASSGDGRSGGSMGGGLDFDDSGDLFSMGRVDSSGWTETSRVCRSRKDSASAAGDLEHDSDLFEISLRD